MEASQVLSDMSPHMFDVSMFVVCLCQLVQIIFFDLCIWINMINVMPFYTITPIDFVDVTIEKQENQDAWESFNQDLQHVHIVWTLKLLKLVCWLKHFTQRARLPEKK